MRRRLLASRWVFRQSVKEKARRMRWGGRPPEPGRRFEAAAPRRKELKSQETRIPNIFLVPGVLDAEEAHVLIKASEEANFELQTSRGPAFGEAHRHHYRVSFEDPQFADALWNAGLNTALAALRVGSRRPVGLNENIRIYKYSGGDVFGKHVDGSNQTARGKTEFTLLIYLSGEEHELVGGETAFYAGGAEVLRVAPVAGQALVHRHGSECLLHESLAVTQGVKYVLRSDVVFADSSE
ncbi:unnamed protein product [Symbiodinium natans]|uniref:Prolyl 4-hydroxylase alpha subunit domain-containing protein n=1 Tax=Symbiodinium natans TaxID=878477 RepID=A0A812PU19_9DINO|nr:unnamed protein product [Symbiodinium natans]